MRPTHPRLLHYTGAEMAAMRKREARWRGLVHGVRSNDHYCQTTMSAESARALHALYTSAGC